MKRNDVLRIRVSALAAFTVGAFAAVPAAAQIDDPRLAAALDTIRATNAWTLQQLPTRS